MRTIQQKMISCFLLSLILTGCNRSTVDIQKKNDPVIDLNESTDIIISMMSSPNREKFFSEILDEPHLIDSLIKNVNPSEIAFESEVLSFGGPVVVLFYKPNEVLSMQVREHLHDFALKNPSVKCVIVNVDIFWKITHQAEIEVFPALSVFDNREEILFVDDMQEWTTVEKAFLNAVNNNTGK